MMRYEIAERKERREQRERRKEERKLGLASAGVDTQLDLVILPPSSGLDLVLKSCNYDKHSLTYTVKVIYSFNKYLLSLRYLPGTWHI